MNLIDILVEQCKKPTGPLGRFMIKTMNVMDSGLNQWAVDQIDCKTGSILEIGCGAGKEISLLRKKFPDCFICGMDYSPDAVRTAAGRNHNAIHSGKVKIVQGDVLALPFDDNSFDYVLAIRTHYFWNELKGALEQVYRVIGSHGTLLILSETIKIEYHMNEYNTNETLCELLRQIGFRSVKIEEQNRCICVTAQK